MIVVFVWIFFFSKQVWCIEKLMYQLQFHLMLQQPLSVHHLLPSQIICMIQLSWHRFSEHN